MLPCPGKPLHGAFFGKRTEPDYWQPIGAELIGRPVPPRKGAQEPRKAPSPAPHDDPPAALVSRRGSVAHSGVTRAGTGSTVVTMSDANRSRSLDGSPSYLVQRDRLNG